MAFLHTVWFTSPTALAGGSGDAQQTVWFLTWTPWAVSHGANPFLTTHINAPQGVNLMWDALSPLAALALWPVTATAGAVVSYDLMVTLDLVLAAWCAYLLLRRHVRQLAALAGGAFYGFCPFLLSQAPSHGKVAFAVMPPLLLLLIDGLLVRRDYGPRRAGLLLGLLVAAQLLVFEEGVVLGLVAGAVVLLVLALRAGRRRTREAVPRLLRALAWAALPLLVIAAVPLGFQLFGPNRVPGTVPGGSVYVTDLANLVVPTPTQLISPDAAQQLTARLSGNTVENASYLGVPLLLLALFAAWRWRRRPLVAVATWSGVALAVLSLGPQLHVGGHVSRLPLPWRVVEAIPVLGSALPSRLWVYVDLGVAVVLAVFVEELLRQRVAALRWAGAAALVLVGVAVFPRGAVAAQPVVPAFFTAPITAAAPAGSTVLVAPYSHDAETAQPMLWQAEAGMSFRMPEGYFVGVDATGTRTDGPARTATSTVMTDVAAGRGVAPAGVDAQILAELRRWKVSAVVVGPMPHEADMIALFTRVLHASPRKRGGAYVWTVTSGTALSRVKAP